MGGVWSRGAASTDPPPRKVVRAQVHQDVFGNEKMFLGLSESPLDDKHNLSCKTRRGGSTTTDLYKQSKCWRPARKQTTTKLPVGSVADTRTL